MNFKLLALSALLGGIVSAGALYASGTLLQPNTSECAPTESSASLSETETTTEPGTAMRCGTVERNGADIRMCIICADGVCGGFESLVSPTPEMLPGVVFDD